MTDDCIGRGKTIKEGGAVYDFISGLQVGIANMANSLAAIKKLVYDEKKITREQLWNAILDDFQSPENKKIQEMLNDEAPKYGNDDDYADNLIVEAYDSYIDEIKKYPNTRYNRGPIGGIRYAGTSSISANVGQGMGTMATPDGRNAANSLLEQNFVYSIYSFFAFNSIRNACANSCMIRASEKACATFCSLYNSYRRPTRFGYGLPYPY